MRVSWLSLAALVLGCTTVSPHASAETEPSVKDLESKTVATLSETRSVQCSGVWTSGQEFVTAFHCLQERKSLDYIVKDDANAHNAKVIATDEAHDLALLRDDRAPAHASAQLDLSAIKPGSRVFSMGHPMQFVWSFGLGRISAVREHEMDWTSRMLFIQSTCTISPGSSGGGLYDEHGHLIGIADAFNSRPEINWYVHGQYVSALLNAPRHSL